jgi:hypothetical protein
VAVTVAVQEVHQRTHQKQEIGEHAQQVCAMFGPEKENGDPQEAG